MIAVQARIGSVIQDERLTKQHPTVVTYMLPVQRDWLFCRRGCRRSRGYRVAIDCWTAPSLGGGSVLAYFLPAMSTLAMS
jgi:hypothetical protein